jgi:CheY-like chemotaxis protein
MTRTDGGRKVRILIIEDNAADVSLLRLALDSANVDCELRVLEDGGEGMAFIRQQGIYAGLPIPDLVVLDVNLPKKDGLEILASMRASALFGGVSVVVLSSSSWPRERAKMEQFGITRFIAKPADLDEYLKIGIILKELLAGM